MFLISIVQLNPFISIFNTICVNTTGSHNEMSKGYLKVKNRVQTIGLKISDVQIHIKLRFGVENSINMHFRLNIPLPTTQNFKQVMIYFTKPNQNLKFILCS